MVIKSGQNRWSGYGNTYEMKKEINVGSLDENRFAAIIPRAKDFEVTMFLVKKLLRIETLFPSTCLSWLDHSINFGFNSGKIT